MKLTWFGHMSFRIEAVDAVLLVDPWLLDNPTFDTSRFDEAIDGATHVLVTHPHWDHATDVPEIARRTKAPVVGMLEYVNWLTAREGVEGMPFNLGGTQNCGGVDVTLVRASHSSSLDVDGTPLYLGTEASFVLSAGGKTLFFAGDTDVHADMEIIQDLHEPDFAVLPIGGHFTMDARRAAYACRKYFSFKAVVASHFGTFPALAQSADEFCSKMEGTGTQVIVPKLMQPFEL